jgi:putative endopeptidase
MRRAKDIPASIAALHQVGIPVAFNFAPDVDLKALDRHIGYFMQGGMGLLDPAYYTNSDDTARQFRELYRSYIKQILALTGTQPGQLETESQAVLAIETRLAQNTKPQDHINNPFNNHVPVAVRDLARQYRNLQLDSFLKAQGVNDDLVSLPNPGFFAHLDTMITQVPVDQWKAYMRWRVGDAMAPYLSKSFRDASFDFRGRILRGQHAQPPRWQQVLEAINTAAGPMLGHEYAAQYLPATTTTQARNIALSVQQAQIAALDSNTWLSEEAKAEARAKLNNLSIEIGLPRRDLDYSMQPMGRGSFGGNMLIASTWRHREEMKRIGRGNAERRWDVLPQHPALTYDIAQNRLIVSAAVLQPPVFDANANPAALYGSYGALVGNQLSRAIDNKGSLVDSHGELRSWWTPSDKSAWIEFGNRIASQFGTHDYPGVKGAKVNGPLVANEGVADLIGLELAWNAFTQTQPDANTPSKQAFFQAWAQLWAQQVSSTAAAKRLVADIHAPGIWRTNVPLSNLPAFGTTFGCKAGQPMQRSSTEQIRIWP